MIRYGSEAKIRSAFSVVTPAGDRLLGVERAEPDLHQRVATARCASRSAAPSSRRRRSPTARRRCRRRSCCEPMTTHLLAGVRVRAGVRGGVVLVAAEHVHAREVAGCSACRTCRWRAPAASAAARRGWPSRSTSTVHSRVSSSYDARLGLGARPVVELHHLRVGLEPVGDLVLGREHRPVVGELDVGQVVVPDRVVQAQRLVAAAPLVARAAPCLSIDDASARRAGAAGRRARCRPGRRRRPARRAGSRSRARGASRSRRSRQVSRSCSRRARRPSAGPCPCGSSWPLSS